MQVEGCGLVFFSTDLEHTYGTKDSNKSGLMLRGKGPHETHFAQHNVRLHSLIMKSDLIEYVFVGENKNFHRCVVSFFF